MKPIKSTLQYIKTAAMFGIGGGLLIMAFQNCAKINFEEVPLSEAVKDSDIDVVCDPFSSETACSSGSGLIGNVFYLPYRFGVDDVNIYNKRNAEYYVEHGIRVPNLLVQLTRLNIEDRSWLQGFPIGNKGLVADQNGNPLLEYFALNLKGNLELKGNFAEGEYELAIASDDGAILQLDGRTFIDNDGHHPIRWACSNKSVTLKKGKKIPVRLLYYQGPRDRIALQVYIRKAIGYADCSERGVGNSTGQWQIIPAEFLSH